MRFVALTSGGQASIHALCTALSFHHELVCLASVFASGSSPLFQLSTPLAPLSISQAMNVPLVSLPVSRRPVHTSTAYISTESDETEDLVDLLSLVKLRFPTVEAVVSGVVTSDYKRFRIEYACGKLGLMSLAPLWNVDPSRLLREQVEAGIEAVVVKAGLRGLSQEWVSKPVADLVEYISEMRDRLGVNVGEEYSTVVVNAPIFLRKIAISETEIEINEKGESVMNVGKIELEDKESGEKSVITPRQNVDLSLKLFVTLSHFETGELTAEGFGEKDCKSTVDEAFVTLRNAKIMLEKNGLTLEDVYYVHVTLRDLSDFLAFNAVYKSFFCKPNPPSRCCIETRLQSPRVQISLRGTQSIKKTLHVQSISPWAPANIGPYSQAVEVQGRLHMAGGIGLIPGEMKLAEDEMTQCIANLKEISAVMGYDIVNSELTVVYFVGQKPEFPINFDPFYIKATRIPKDGKIEVEMHIKKTLPPMKSEEIALQTSDFTAIIHKKFNSDVIFAVFRIEISLISSISPFLTSLKSHFDDYFMSVSSKSPTKAVDLLSTSPLSTSILDYITEVRVVSPNPDSYRESWIAAVPSVFITSETSAILVRFEDRLQLATYDFVHEDRNS